MNKLKLYSIAFGMLIGLILMMTTFAKSQDITLKSKRYIHNSIEVSGDVRLSIYNWEYFVISIGDFQDTIPYTTIDRYKLKDQSLSHIIVPDESPIDSMSLGWENDGYIKYKSGDIYEFTNLYKVKKRKL